VGANPGPVLESSKIGGMKNSQGFDRACLEVKPVGGTAWLCSEANRMYKKAASDQPSTKLGNAKRMGFI
jgi:hypothetical protein